MFWDVSSSLTWSLAKRLPQVSSPPATNSTTVTTAPRAMSTASTVRRLTATTFSSWAGLVPTSPSEGVLSMTDTVVPFSPPTGAGLTLRRSAR